MAGESNNADGELGFMVALRGCPRAKNTFSWRDRHLTVRSCYELRIKKCVGGMTRLAKTRHSQGIEQRKCDLASRARLNVQNEAVCCRSGNADHQASSAFCRGQHAITMHRLALKPVHLA